MEQKAYHWEENKNKGNHALQIERSTKSIQNQTEKDTNTAGRKIQKKDNDVIEIGNSTTIIQPLITNKLSGKQNEIKQIDLLGMKKPTEITEDVKENEGQIDVKENKNKDSGVATMKNSDVFVEGVKENKEINVEKQCKGKDSVAISMETSTGTIQDTTEIVEDPAGKQKNNKNRGVVTQDESTEIIQHVKGSEGNNTEEHNKTQENGVISMENSVEIIQGESKYEEKNSGRQNKTWVCDLYNTIKKGASYIFDSRIGRLFFRFLPLFISFWTFQDVGLDFYQAKLYYEYATIGIKNCMNTFYEEDENFSIESRNISNFDQDSNIYKISPIYFATSVFIFNLPLLFRVIISNYMFGIYGCFNDPERKSLYRYKAYISSCHMAIRFFFVLLIIPVLTYIRAIFGSIVLLPIFSLYFSIKNAVHGQIESTNRIDVFGHFYFTPEVVAHFFLLENFGEAAPQIALSIIFLVNNPCENLHSYNILGIEIPTTILSLIFSVVSLIIGTLRTMPTAIKLRKKEKRVRKALKNAKRITDDVKIIEKVSH